MCIRDSGSAKFAIDSGGVLAPTWYLAPFANDTAELVLISVGREVMYPTVRQSERYCRVGIEDWEGG